MRTVTNWKRRLMPALTLACLAAAPALAQNQAAQTVLGVRLNPYCRVSVMESSVTSVNANRTEVRGFTRFQYWMRTSAAGGEGSLLMALPAASLPAGTQWTAQTVLGRIGVALETGANPSDSPATVARFGQRSTTPATGLEGRIEWVLTSPAPLPGSLPPHRLQTACR